MRDVKPRKSTMYSNLVGGPKYNRYTAGSAKTRTYKLLKEMSQSGNWTVDGSDLTFTEEFVHDLGVQTFPKAFVRQWITENGKSESDEFYAIPIQDGSGSFSIEIREITKKSVKIVGVFFSGAGTNYSYEIILRLYRET